MTSAREYRENKMPHSVELCYGSKLHCYWHNEDEPEAEIFRACLECRHVYQTPADLLAAWFTETGYQWPDADSVPACAYCGHDW